jgi:hypothetical protein
LEKLTRKLNSLKFPTIEDGTGYLHFWVATFLVNGKANIGDIVTQITAL